MFHSNRRRTNIHVEVENSKFSSVNGDFLRNTIDVSLAPYHYHVILRYLRIQSLDLADIRSIPILCTYVYVTCKYQMDWTINNREKVETPLSLLFAYKSQCSQVHRQTFVRIRKHSDRSRGIANIRNMFLNSV